MEWRTSLIRLLKKPMIRAEKISSRFQVRSVIDRIHQHADQHAGHFYADRAEDDPADPSLGLHHAARLDGDHLPDKGANERQGADAARQSLRVAGPDLDQVFELVHKRLLGKRSVIWAST